MKSTELSRMIGRMTRLLRTALRRRRLALAAVGVLGFALAFLPHVLTNPLAPFHYTLCTELDRALAPGHRLVGALPREHGKTSLGTLAVVLRELCLGDKRNVLLVAANRAEAEGKLRQIVHEIETNRLIPPSWRARLAPARDQKSHPVAYGDAEVVLAGGARISTLGIGGRVRGQLERGRRLDLVILDDPEDDATVASPEQRRKLRHWVDHALINALDVEQGSLIWLGTLLHHDSVLAQWLEHQRKHDGAWRVIKLAALTGEGAPLWPGRWSRERLEQRRAEIGDAAFAQEFLNRPVSLAGQVFRDGDFRHFDPAELRHADGQWHVGREPLQLAVGVDPAVGQGSEHDYFAACVVGVNAGLAQDGPLQVFLLDVLRTRARFAEQLEALVQLARKWRPRLIGVEAVAYQAALAQAAWDLGLPVVPLGEQRAKAVRIEAAAVHVAQGRVRLPIAAPWVADFRAEARDYPAGRFDDQLDAFARALEVALPLARGGGEICAAGQQRSGMRGTGFAPNREDWLKGF